MATPRPLSKPPIKEALVDFRTTVARPPEDFEALGQELRFHFPKSEIRREIRAELRVQDGKLIPPRAELLGFEGIRLANADETIFVQFRPDGFTFNNLKSYIGGDRLITEALGLWSRFAERLQPSVVTRVAFRYINELHLPLRPDDIFTKYLTAPPELPEGAPQKVSEFLSRVVGHDLRSESTAVVTQRLKVDPSGKPVVLIDVDIFRQGEFSVNPDHLRPILDSLRLLRNQTFFSLLTDEAVNLYA